ncbi:alpha/beta hydrolase [Fragilaria crotonensis]|nr:alpha/beta hydrolase [Fragilaria crotonensis]
MTLSSRQAAPVVVLHGGPSLPADYLYPLEQAVEYRSIVFYDQIGCGRSDEPNDKACYSIDMALDDLEALLKILGIRRFHLYGQSFGGILAYEYLKRRTQQSQLNVAKDADPVCLSCVLSSTPTSVKRVEETYDQLLDALAQDPTLEGISLQERFRMTHQCRMAASPQPLLDAYAHAGTVWRGTDAIKTWEATPISDITNMESSSSSSSSLPPMLILRGEYDFVTEECSARWKEVLLLPGTIQQVRFRVLKRCSHHGLLEDGPKYGEVLDSFFAEFD